MIELITSSPLAVAALVLSAMAGCGILIGRLPGVDHEPLNPVQRVILACAVVGLVSLVAFTGLDSEVAADGGGKGSLEAGPPSDAPSSTSPATAPPNTDGPRSPDNGHRVQPESDARPGRTTPDSPRDDDAGEAPPPSDDGKKRPNPKSPSTGQPGTADEPVATQQGEPDRLAPGERLGPGERLVSADGRYVLRMQRDGNLVLVAPGNRPLWSSGTSDEGVILANQTDGNIVLIAKGNRPVWETGTHEAGDVHLVLQSDGNLVAYRHGAPVWATNTP